MPDIPPDGLAIGPDGRPRCWWGDATDEYRAYHDAEWGFPVDTDVRLFEKLVLEGFQAGLSWLTILRKREHFRRAFAGFDYAQVAQFDAADVERLLADAGIIRHRARSRPRSTTPLGPSSSSRPKARWPRTRGVSSRRHGRAR